MIGVIFEAIAQTRVVRHFIDTSRAGNRCLPSLESVLLGILFSVCHNQEFISLYDEEGVLHQGNYFRGAYINLLNLIFRHDIDGKGICVIIKAGLADCVV